ncbi:MAG: AAA family ATPase [Selenomonadaceae bacterium]|nr:AAA family ATPase [Selenomonadaceae bacterium]
MTGKNFDLPQAIEMEKSVLGAMMLKRGLVIPNVRSVLKEDDFYRVEHRMVYRVLLDLYDAGIEPNILSLSEELRKRQELDKVGLRYVFMLAESAWTTGYAQAHAKVIKEKAILRRLMLLGEVLQEDASQDVKPLQEIMQEASVMLEELKKLTSETTSSGFSTFFKEKFGTKVEEMKEYASRKTGFANLDSEQIFTPGLYVLGGLPALGKTTFAWQLLEQMARQGEKCVYCSYEMSEFELYTKSAMRELFSRDRNTKLTSAGIRRGDETRTLKEILVEFGEIGIDLTVVEMQEQDIDDLIFGLRKYCVEKAPVIVLDYLQIVPVRRREASAKQGIDEIVRKLKNFQRETGATFIVISSFNRQNYGQQVAFESFKESGNIEYSADVVWGLQLYATRELKEGATNQNREIISKAKEANPRQVELKCLKNRQGKNYSCYFKYYAAVDTFESCKEEDFKKVNVEVKSKKVKK